MPIAKFEPLPEMFCKRIKQVVTDQAVASITETNSQLCTAGSTNVGDATIVTGEVTDKYHF